MPARRRVFVTSLAAVATLVVVVLVLAGPAIVSCSSGTESIAACLRAKVVDAGILPEGRNSQPEAPAVATPATEPDAPATVLAEPGGAEAITEPVPETAVATVPETVPAASVDVATPLAPDAQTIAPAELPPIVSLLRVESDGAFLMAGTAAPGTSIEVFAGSELVGTAVAEKSGDWVLVPDAPLPKGTATLTIGATEGQVTQSFNVVVPTDGAVPLITANEPGLTIEPTAPATEEVAALAEPVEPSAPATVQPEPATAAETPVAEAPIDADLLAEAPAAPVTADEASDVAAIEPDAAMLPEPETVTLTAVTPTIDAIEIDGTRNFFAGAGDDGARVRLFVDDVYIGTAVVSGGRWLVEGDHILERGAQRVRIEVQDAAAPDLIGRAEVNFILDAPEVAEPPPASISAGTVHPVELDPPPLPEPERVAATPQVLAPTVLPTAPPPVPEIAAVSPSELAPAPVQPASDVAAQDLPHLRPAPAWPPAVAPATEAAAPDPIAPVADRETVDVATAPRPQPGRFGTSPSVVVAPTVIATPSIEVLRGSPALPRPAPDTLAAEARASAPPVTLGTDGTEVPNLVAVPVGDPSLARFASGRAIIRHGDTLWSIAARVYGAGLKYNLIVRANRELIRNPHRIYPGQVFELPLE